MFLESRNKKCKLEKLFKTCNVQFGKRKRSDFEEEVSSYLKQLVVSLDSDILDWWKRHQNEFPHLAAMAQKFLSIPATQVTSERCFSISGRVVETRRTRLSPDHVEQISFLHGNLK